MRIKKKMVKRPSKREKELQGIIRLLEYDKGALNSRIAARQSEIDSLVTENRGLRDNLREWNHLQESIRRIFK